MTNTISVKVSNRNQIAIPSIARKELNIQAGDRLIVDIQDGMLVLIPQPTNYVAHMAGLHREIWENVDTDNYIQGERDEWTE